MDSGQDDPDPNASLIRGNFSKKKRPLSPAPLEAFSRMVSALDLGVQSLNGMESESIPVDSGSYKDKLIGNQPSKYSSGHFRSLLEDSFSDHEESDEEYSENDEDSDCQWPRIWISKEDLAEIRKPWRNALIVKLLGKSLSYNYLLDRLKQRWNTKGEFKFIDIGCDFYIVKFSSVKDLQFVMSKEPWIIAGHYLSMQKWNPDFDPAREKIIKTTVWIRLPGLPIEYFNSKAFIEAGNQIGKLIKFDKATEDSERGKFARICVEINLGQPLIPKVKIGRLWRRVEYEGLHSICFKCGVYGHSQDNCHVNPE
ncbi:Zinc ion binding,nucleic acid binding-like protein [Quillaja saponaria]|uniref:Zinc ion binding,nucleic acid binding-like protein n=1 Tax=Quillaja saponaria TaxID=32244 RepID=A0AAD7LA91_QUISA|nr:Zinc ion binding,nucleic acid binding-like protein [Quillaja saponaria]